MNCLPMNAQHHINMITYVINMEGAVARMEHMKSQLSAP